MKDQNRSEVSRQRDQTKELRTQQAKINGLISVSSSKNWKKNTGSDLAAGLGPNREFNPWQS